MRKSVREREEAPQLTSTRRLQQAEGNGTG